MRSDLPKIVCFSYAVFVCVEFWTVDGLTLLETVNYLARNDYQGDTSEHTITFTNRDFVLYERPLISLVILQTQNR